MLNTPNINFTKRSKQEDSNASLNLKFYLLEQLIQKRYFFSNQEGNTAVNSKEEDSTDIEDSYHYDSPIEKTVLDSFIDVREERERLAFCCLTSSLNKLDKKFEQNSMNNKMSFKEF